MNPTTTIKPGDKIRLKRERRRTTASDEMNAVEGDEIVTAKIVGGTLLTITEKSGIYDVHDFEKAAISTREASPNSTKPESA